jgi:hypothetical protein
MFVLGIGRPEDKSGRSFGATGTSKDEQQAAFERSMMERVTAVETGYAAFYREEGGSREIGVYAIRLKTPLTDAEAQRFRASQGAAGPRAQKIKGTVAVLAWSDGRVDAPDRGCWDVVRRHLEQVDVE